MAQLPDYLLAELAKPRPKFLAPVEALITPGEIRTCEGTGERRLVLVLEVHRRHVNIVLLTNDIDMAADQTSILTEAMTR